MKKILIAINDDFLMKIYEGLFQEKGFNVLSAGNNQETLSIISNDSPDIVILDVDFAQEDDFDLLKKIKSNDAINKIPIVLYSKIKEGEYKEKAIEFELKDFIVGPGVSPMDVLNRIRIHLSVEKSYRVAIDVESEIIKEIAKDLGYDDLTCKKCLKPLKLYLIRDLKKESNYFKVSFICTDC